VGKSSVSRSGSWHSSSLPGRAEADPNGRLSLAVTVPAMLYDVLVVSEGEGERRFTFERDTPLSDGDEFKYESGSYRVLSIQPGHGPFDGVIEAEWLGTSGSARLAP
jgi:hypothetical protein